MQNWKIKRMSVKRINRWLSEIAKMINHYEGKARVSCCPLCKVVPTYGCNACLWRIIEGVDCEDFAHQLYSRMGASSYRNNLRFKNWSHACLTQLSRWKKILQVELKRRDELAA